MPFFNYISNGNFSKYSILNADLHKVQIMTLILQLEKTNRCFG